MPNRSSRLLLTVAWGAMMIAATAAAQTRPTGGQVRAGDAAIGNTRNGLLITQGSDRAVIDWNSFSVGQGGLVDFRNGDGATLNRVTGDGVSHIDGRLTATGSVYVMNGAGVIVGATGLVDVGGTFVAATLDVSNADFMNGGDLVFSGDSDASVVNFGRIGALGGDVALIGARVENRGTIVAQDGTAALAAGYEVLMRDAALADGQFVVRLGGDETEALNTGRIQAAAVELRANQGNVLALAGNTDGLIRAEGIRTEGGRIFLTAPGGEVQVAAPVQAPAGDIVLNADDITLAGMVDVSSLSTPGGSITVEGDDITLTGRVTLDANGTEGGLIRIGGDLQGGRVPGFGAAMETATTVTVARDAQISADGTDGQGGDVVLWSDGGMTFRGAISATGTGDAPGGFAEVSGGFLLYAGTADLRSESGVYGDLLLDPFNITISGNPSSGMTGFTAGANNSVLNATVLTDALGTANVNVFTGVPGGQAGNINVNAPLSWTGGGRLTLTAANNIDINRAITASTGGLIIDAGGTISATAAVDVGLFDLRSGDWIQEIVNLPAFSADDFRFDPANATFLRRAEFFSPQDEGNVFGVVDIYGLQGLASHELLGDETNISGVIDATGTGDWNNGAGFRPIGTLANAFTGQLNGVDAYILGLVINRPSANNVGLVGYSDRGNIRRLVMIDADITGRNNVGAFAGQIIGDFEPDGYLDFSFATGTVTATETTAGGLVGLLNDGSIYESWARVDVTGTTDVGGLVGRAEFLGAGVIEDTYAVGSVTATATNGVAGGLVGTVDAQGSFNDTVPDILTSYASGEVDGATAGGLIGYNAAGIANFLYWDTETTGQAEAVGAVLNGIDNLEDDASGLTSEEARNPSSYFGGLNSVIFSWFLGDGLRPMLVMTPSDLIYEPEQLQIIADFGFGRSLLMRDIDFGAYLADPSGIWGPQGLLPLGQGEGAFGGQFDGQGHTIDGLMINRPNAEYVGLFGTTNGDDEEFSARAVAADIQNLALTNVDITGGRYTGGLAGLLIGTSVAQIYVSGEVNGDDGYTGGLFGDMDGGTITNVVSYADVTGTFHVGGLAGDADFGVTITDSYAHGDVTGTDIVGGLVAALGADAVLTRTFATGRITAATTVGGLVGRNEGTVLASFWDRTATGRNTPFGTNVAGAQGVTGLTTAAFQNTLGFLATAVDQGWDFERDWAPSAPGFYPANYTIEPVVFVDADSVARTYGATNAGLVVTGPSFGGPSSYVFDTPGDTLAVNAAALFGPFPNSLDVGFYLYGSRGGLTSDLGIDYRVVSATGLQVTPAPLVVTPDDITRIYGNNDRRLTFDISGFVLGQNRSILTGSLERLPGEDVGSYAITPGTLSAGTNYTISFAGSPSFTITPRPLTIEADDISSIFGEGRPTLTYAIIDGNLVFNDTLTGELAADGATAPGVFTIGQGTLTAGGNYAITFLPGTLTVIAPDNQSQPLQRSIDNFIPIDFDTETFVDPFFPQENAFVDVGPDFTTEGTDAIVDQLQQATAYCSVIGQSEYVIDCLSERLAVIAASLPEGGDYADARAALNAAAGRLSDLVEQNQDSEFPANLTRSLRPDAPPASRPLRPVRTDNLASTLAAASGILAETQTQLLRSASASQESIHYQRIATAVGSTNTILLRST